MLHCCTCKHTMQSMLRWLRHVQHLVKQHSLLRTQHVIVAARIDY